MVEGFNATQRELEILELRKEVSALKTNVEYWRLAAERRDTRKELTGLDVPEARTLDAPEPPQCEVRTAEAFDSWFDGNFLDPDGGSSHLPDWFRGDMQRAWDAGRFAQASAWSASTHDEIIKRLMAGVGMPNSTSLYVAFKQFANELHALSVPSASCATPCSHAAIIGLDGMWHCQKCGDAIDMAVAHSSTGRESPTASSPGGSTLSQRLPE